MVICDCCEQGFHTACFGMAAVPDADPWHCPGCKALQQLAVGQQIITESPQLLYRGSAAPQPHHTQALYMATITSLGPMEHDATGRSRRVHVQSSLAPLPGSVRFYSTHPPYAPLQQVPQQSQNLSELLLQRPGTSAMDITLASSRYGMLGTAAACADLTTEAWLAGPACAGEALLILGGPPRQAFICSSSVSSSTNGTATATSAAGRSLLAQQEKPAAVASGHACVGCGALSAERALQQCPLCRYWSCSAPCSGAAAGPVAPGGRPKRQGAGQRWSCPNPECAAAAAPASEPGSDPNLAQSQLLAAAAHAPAPSRDASLPQQPSNDPAGPSPVPAPAALFFPGPGATLQDPVYTTGQHTDPTQPQINPVPTAGPSAYPPPMQSGMLPGPPYQLLQPGSAWPWGMPAAHPMMGPPAPATLPYPPVWQMPGMMLPPPFMSPWGWLGYPPPMAWPGTAAYPGSMPGQPTGAAAAAGGGGSQRVRGSSSSRRPKGKKQRQQLVQEAAGVSDEDEAAADDSDDDWLTLQNQPSADGRPTQVSRVVFKVRSQVIAHGLPSCSKDAL